MSKSTDRNAPARPVALPRVLAAGICALVIGIGVGRFAYTPLLPALQQAAGIGSDIAGLLASVNYVGYLAGALGVTALPPQWSRVRAFRLALVASIVSTAMMALAPSVWLWAGSRLIAGVASAGALILSADIVVRNLNRHGRPALIGVQFAGVGIGVAMTGIVTALLEDRVGWAAGWIVLGTICVVLAPMCWLWLDLPGRDAPAAPAAAAPAGGARFPLGVLALAYFCEGAGYIVTGTFLVAIVKTMPGLADVAAHFWIVVGIAAAPSAIFWSRVGQRIGLLPALFLSHVVQAVGVVLPVLSAHPAAVLVSAVLFGATFVGITALVVAFAGRNAAANPTRMIGVLTASFSLGQIIGPIVAGVLAEGGQGFAAALVLAAATVMFGAILLMIGGLLPAKAAGRTAEAAFRTPR
jgi:predicted MFS family arabinose efflux permease